jgi:hypothetical protein
MSDKEKGSPKPAPQKPSQAPRPAPSTPEPLRERKELPFKKAFDYDLPTPEPPPKKK